MILFLSTFFSNNTYISGLIYPVSAKNYMKINSIVEKWTKIIHFGFIKCLLNAVMTPKLFFSYYLYCATDLKNDAFDLPFPLWQPFDWKNPIGYLIAFAIQYISLGHLYILGAAVISLEIGCYLWMMELIEDIKNDINSINKTAKLRKNQTQMSKQLTDSIEFHSKVKQLSEIR